MIFLLLAFAILFSTGRSAAVIGPPDPIQQLMQRVRENARQEPPGLQIQSLLAAAELLRPAEPSAAESFIRDCLAILKSGQHIDEQIMANVLEVGMRIDPAEVLESLPFVPDRRAVDNALISYYLKQGTPEKAIALVNQSGRQGLTDLSGAILILRQLIQQRPSDGVTFFNEMLSSAPNTLDPEEALFLLTAVREVVFVNPRLALRAVFRIAVSAQSSEFSSGFAGTLTAKYRIGGCDVWTSDIRESVLLPALAYLHVLAPDKYPEFAVSPEHEKLLTAVTSETVLESTQPLQIIWLKADLKPEPKADLTAFAGRELSTPGSASLLPVRPKESLSKKSLDGLFEKLRQAETSNHARRAIERQALQEIRRMPPDRQRVGAAAELLSLAAGQEGGAMLEPIIGGFLSWLLPLARGYLTSSVGDPEDSWCGSMYSFVASQIHQHHVTISENDPSLTTRLALLDLRDRLQKSYDFRLNDMNARQYTLRQFRGHVVVLRFWSAHCGTCVKSLPELEKLYREHAQKHVAVLAIGDEPEAVTRPFLKTRGYTFPFLFDDDATVSGYFGISIIPTTIVIDQAGGIVASIVGDPSCDQLRQIINKVKYR